MTNYFLPAILYLDDKQTHSTHPNLFYLGQSRKATMVNKDKAKLTLDQLATYQIKVPGELDENWPDWAGEMKVIVESDEDDQPVTTLSGILDQAALLGLVRRLYSLGLPLISVICLEVE